MALNINGTRLLLRAQRQGINFEKTVMIGRQRFYLSSQALQTNLEEYGYQGADAAALIKLKNGYTEPFFELLGAKTIDSIDASAYEEAAMVHDMNFPIPEEWKERYSVVLDGGSLEHIFNFPMAIRNCMELLEIGGTYLGITPANNFFGHGFYQFSPELYFRIFSAENGFAVKEILFYHDIKHRQNQERSPFYKVSDPEEVRHRVELTNAYASYLFVVAERVEKRLLFERFPQQSDYEKMSWKKEKKVMERTSARVQWMRKITPQFLRDWRRQILLATKPLGNAKKRFFNRQD